MPMLRISPAGGRIAFTVALFVIATSGTTGLALAADDPAPVHRALLIGINDYQTDQFMDLRGAVNDVETMREILTTRFGFSPENVVVLTDANATRKAILAAFEKLVEETGERDVVYIHYSGHGSQVKDLNGDEPNDGKDETILSHDARTEGIPDITDDELGGFLARLKAERAVIILDSCHSGTATRGMIATRSVPPDTRDDLYRTPANEISTRSLVLLDRPENYVLLTGAASNQSALDGPLDGQYRGFFSYALGKCLSSGETDFSPRKIHDGVQKIYTRVSEDFGGLQLPEPQVEASEQLMDEPLFPVARGVPSASRPFLEAQAEGPGMVRLKRGLSLGAGPDTYWALFSPGENDLRVRNAFAAIKIVEIQEPDVIGILDPEDAEVLPGTRAVEVSYSPPAPHVTVRWESRNPQVESAIEEQVQQRMPEAEFVGPDDFSRFSLEISGDVCRVYDAAGQSIEGEFPLVSAAEVGSHLAGIFSRSLKASSLVAMTNPASELEIEARVVGADEDDTMRVRKAGDKRKAKNSLMLEVNVDADCYLTIVDVDPEGTVNVLFPNNYTKAGFLPEGFVKRGEKVRIPDSLKTGNHAGFFWDYQPPFGVDTIQIFACTDSETADTIREWISQINEVGSRGIASGSAVTTTQQLGRLRAQLTPRVTSRGVRVVADVPAGEEMPPPDPGAMSLPERAAPEADWNSTSLRIRIEK